MTLLKLANFITVQVWKPSVEYEALSTSRHGFAFMWRVLTAQLNITDGYFFRLFAAPRLPSFTLRSISIMTMAGVISFRGHDASVNFDSGSGGSRRQSSMIARLVDWDLGSSLVNRVEAKY